LEASTILATYFRFKRALQKNGFGSLNHAGKIKYPIYGIFL